MAKSHRQMWNTTPIGTSNFKEYMHWHWGLEKGETLRSRYLTLLRRIEQNKLRRLQQWYAERVKRELDAKGTVTYDNQSRATLMQRINARIRYIWQYTRAFVGKLGKVGV